MTTNRQEREADHSENVLSQVYDIVGRSHLHRDDERLQSAAVDCRCVLGQWQMGVPSARLRDRMHGITRLLYDTIEIHL